MQTNFWGRLLLVTLLRFYELLNKRVKLVIDSRELRDRQPKDVLCEQGCDEDVFADREDKINTGDRPIAV